MTDPREISKKSLLPAGTRDFEEARRTASTASIHDPVFERLLGVEVTPQHYAQGRAFWESVVELTDEATLSPTDVGLRREPALAPRGPGAAPVARAHSLSRGGILSARWAGLESSLPAHVIDQRVFDAYGENGPDGGCICGPPGARAAVHHLPRVEGPDRVRE